MGWLARVALVARYLGLGQWRTGLIATATLAVLIGGSHTAGGQTLILDVDPFAGTGSIASDLGPYVSAAACSYWQPNGGRAVLAIRSDGALALHGGPNASLQGVPAGLYATVKADSGIFAAIRSDGTLVCWIGAFSPLASLKVPSGKFTSIATSAGTNPYGYPGFLGIRQDGTLAAWKLNFNLNNAIEFMPVPPGRYTSVAIGWDASAAIREDGALITWDTATGVTYPSPDPSGKFNFVGGTPDFVALRNNGDLLTWWGLPTTYQHLGTKTGPFSFADTSFETHLALRPDGALLVWDWDHANPWIPQGRFYSASENWGVHVAIRRPAPKPWSVIRLHPANALWSIANAVDRDYVGGSADVNGGNAIVWSAPTWSPTVLSMWTESSISGVDSHTNPASVQFVGTSDNHVALWNGIGGPVIDMRPSGFGGGAVQATSDGQQGGWAVFEPGLSDIFRAFVWTGTPGSFVNLERPGISTGDEFCFGVGGGQQVGRAYFDACLWNGTPNSFVSLHPAGANMSEALATDGHVQAGWTWTTGQHAALWRGTRESWVDLNPAGVEQSKAYALSGDYQVGWAYFGGRVNACLWRGTPESYFDLSAPLPSEFNGSPSIANGVWTDGNLVRIVGQAKNTLTGQWEAVMWEQQGGTPPSTTLVNNFDGESRTIADGGVSLSNRMFMCYTGTDPDSVTAFEYSLDYGPYTHTGTSAMLCNLSLGRHILRVRAVDTFGDADTTPATLTWSVATPAGGIASLADQIAQLGLNGHSANVLLVPLQQAAALLSNSNPSDDHGVAGKMTSFIAKVNQSLARGEISQAEADNLISLATAIRNDV